MERTKEKMNTKTTDPEHNKRVAMEFFELAFNHEKPEEPVQKYMGPYYNYHDTERPDGKEGFIPARP